MRSAPEEALERIALWLNLQEDADVSFNKISKQTGLAWATVVKYSNAIERLAACLPKVSVSDKGVHVHEAGPAFKTVVRTPSERAALALFWHDQQKTQAGGASASIIEPGFRELETMEFAMRTPTWQLTRDGYTYAVSLMGEVQKVVADSNRTHHNAISFEARLPERQVAIMNGAAA